MSSYRAEHAFLADDLRTFLRVVDRHLSRGTRMENLFREPSSGGAATRRTS
jgi:hypothetical protein